MAISKHLAEKYNLPTNMTKADFKLWKQHNSRIEAHKKAKLPVREVDRNDRFAIINKYYNQRGK